MIARVVIGCVAVFALTLAVRAEEPKETKFKPTLVLTGTHSLIKNERFVQVLGADAWEQIWEEHRGKDGSRFTETYQELDINFETHYVIAICVANGMDAPTITPRVRGETIVLGFRRNYLQIEVGRKLSPEARAREDAMSPYAFVILPRPVRPILIEQDVQGHLGEPPVWKERVRFPAPKDKK